MRPRGFLSLTVAASVAARSALAVLPAHRTEAAPPATTVRFNADRVELDPKLKALELTGNVDVRAGRFRIQSQRLELSRSAYGVVVDGEGSVSFCPCAAPPISLGFQSATVAPPSDLFLESPTLRVAGVPIAWLPYFWLRSPQRVGVLPPRIAWRGAEGLWFGSGVHVPFGKQATTTLDIGPSVYLKGGVRLDTWLRTPTSNSSFTWDRLKRDFLQLESLGYGGADQHALAWDIDALRGSRARSATPGLDEAARPHDHALVRLGYWSSPLSWSLGGTLHAARASELDDFGAGGPQTRLSLATPILDVGTGLAELGVRSGQTDGQTESEFSERSALQLGARPGPFAWETELSEELQLVEARARTAGASRFGARTELALPLVKDYAGGVRHLLEPLGLARVRTSKELAAPLEHTLLLAFGLRSALADYAERTGAELELASGPLWRNRSAVELGASGRLVADARLLAFSARGVWIAPGAQFAVASRGRLGSLNSVHLLAGVDGQNQGGLEVADAFGETFGLARAPWFDRSGWGSPFELRVPWARWLATSLGANYDLTAARWLSVFGSLSYHHPCDCLATVLWSGQRMGREGVDVWMTVNISP